MKSSGNFWGLLALGVCIILSVNKFTGTKRVLTDSYNVKSLPRWLNNKESTCSTEYKGSIPRLGGSPGGGHCNPLQYSCLENPMDRGARRATVHGITQS